MRDDWTTYRFFICDSWVAFDDTTLLASGPHPARFSAFTSLRHYPQAPPCAVLNRTGSTISRFQMAKTQGKNDFEKKTVVLKSIYHVDPI